MRVTCAWRRCGRRFEAERSTARYCSTACRVSAHRAARRPRPELVGIVRKGTLAERGHDLYETPATAIRALLRAEPLPPVMWEPAAGRGAIVRELRASGRTVVASDLVAYEGADPEIIAGVDFLRVTSAPPEGAAIVTNPPFKILNRFVAHAVKLCPKVVLFAPQTFLATQERSALLRSSGFARALLIQERLPMMHRQGWSGRRITQGSKEYGWFVFDREHHGEPVLRWISIRASRVEPGDASTAFAESAAGEAPRS
jgi:hypothetical protein